MVAGLDYRPVVGDQYLVVADDGTDGGARRQGNFLNGAADHLA